MARPVKELERLSLQLRGQAFIVAAETPSVLRTCVRVAASQFNVELSEAELEVIVDHLESDMFDFGANLGFIGELLELEREVDEDYAKGWEDDEGES